MDSHRVVPIRQPVPPGSLTIVIPALNEEEAIGETIQKCLDARERILRETPIGDVEIIVVSDGSTDRTAEIAQSYDGVKVIVHFDNLGYGAAIKSGFAEGRGEILGFLDADGTCDPQFFVNLCQACIEESADVVVGSRMNDESRMPALRRLGNAFFARLVSYLAGTRITDTASGMRVLRREALKKLQPLPTGLHFTPAMTCRALTQKDLSIVEVPIPYHERLGRSKLSVFRDGLRFLLIIAEITLSYCPLKFFGAAATVLGLLACGYGLGPLWSYLVEGIVPERFIYRLITVNTLILAALASLTVGIVAERVAAALVGNERKHCLVGRLLLSTCTTLNMLRFGLVPIVVGILLNLGPIVDYLTTRQITYHWTYIATGSVLVLAGIQITAMGILELLLTRILERNSARERCD
ncbi:MAG: glycosyltransferase family 2 protein [Syntrophobacteraceae bacterium]|jgi:glycosyltransferase involved in cell wall biosynthesis|nr:glycosyltransferase family 2 protein [Syntrophobacteraceae bacterium]